MATSRRRPDGLAIGAHCLTVWDVCPVPALPGAVSGTLWVTPGPGYTHSVPPTVPVWAGCPFRGVTGGIPAVEWPVGGGRYTRCTTEDRAPLDGVTGPPAEAELPERDCPPRRVPRPRE
ncbi:hypothetical protein GCM10027452_40030 [Micromonospora halotolerans]